MAAYLDAGVIELVPPDAIRQNARLALRMGDSESAIRHYEYLMGTGDFPLDIMGEAAEAHEANRDFPEAAALLRRLAEELVRSGDYRAAIDVLRRVANYPRPEPEALRYLVDLVFENPRAAGEFAANIVEAGKTLVAYYIGQDQADDALDLLQRLLKTFPDEVAFADSLVNVYYEQGNRDQAAAECERLANSYLKRKRPAHAVSLYKKLLVIDPERQDVREKIRKTVSGRRRRTSTSSALPRFAAFLAVTLLLGAVGIVMFKKNSGDGDTSGAIPSDMTRRLLTRAREEKQSAAESARRAIEEFRQLVDDVRDDPVAHREALLARIRTAMDQHQLFLEGSGTAVSIAETIQKQSGRREDTAQAQALLETLEEHQAQVENAYRAWQVEANRTARRLFDEAEGEYKAKHLKAALDRYELARQLSSEPDWKASKSLEQAITNIRTDMDFVVREIKKAKAKEDENDFTTARQILLDLLHKYGFWGADIVQDVLLPLEIVTIPPGATLTLDGVEYSRPTPCLVRLNPHKGTVVEVRKKTFLTEKRTLGPFGLGTDPAKHTYTIPLLKTSTWTRSFRGGELIESPPVAWGPPEARRVAVVTRSGDWAILDADDENKTIARQELEGADVTAGLATDGRTVMIPTLDGRLVALDAQRAEVLYTFRGTTKLPLGPVHGAPAVMGSVFYIADGEGHVYAFDSASREAVWAVETPHSVRASPVLQGGHVVVVSTFGDVTVLRRSTGQEVAHYKLQGTFVCSPAVVGEDNLIFAAEDGELFGVKRLTGEPLWKSIKVEGAIIRRTPPVRGNTVFVSPRPGFLVAVNTDTGDHLYIQGNPAAQRGPVNPANRVNRIFFVHENILTAYGPGQDGYGQAWSFQARGKILGGPVVEGDAVYIGDETGNLYRLEANE